MPVSLFWAVKNGKITTGIEVSKKDTRNKEKNGMIKGIIWLLVALLLFGLAYNLGMMELLPDLLESMTDVNGVTGPLGIMLCFPLLLAFIITIFAIFFCMVKSIKCFSEYFKNND